MSEISWLDPLTVRRLVCCTACIGVFVSSLEWLVPLSKLGPEGLLAPRFLGGGGTAADRLGRFWRPSGLRLVLALRLACAVVFLTSVLLAPHIPEAGLAVFVGGLLCLPLRFRDPIGVRTGMDGAEQLMTSTLLALGATFVLKSPVALEAALAFVAGQAILEYAGAGWTKLRDWRGWARGIYLRQVFSNSNYGHRWAAERAAAHPAVTRILSIAVIGLEIAVPCALVLPAPMAEILLLAALAFHLGSAVIMGLNTFVWSYAATYPAILHCRDLLLGVLVPRAW